MSGSSAIMASATTGCGKRMQRIIAEKEGNVQKPILVGSTCISCHVGKILAARPGKAVCDNCGKKVRLG